MSAHLGQSAMHQGGSLRAMFACIGVLLIGSVQMSKPPQSAAHFTAPHYVQAVGDAVSGASLLSDPAISHDGQPDQLFGMDAEPVASGELLEQWRRVKTSHRSSNPSRDAARTDPAVPQNKGGRVPRVLTSPNPLSTLLQRFACAHLSPFPQRSPLWLLSAVA
jgi:hypothetical protein